jgi:hypothetical protein
MVVACRIHGKEVKCRSENVEEKDHVKDVNIDGRKTLAGSCEHGGCREKEGIY